VGSAPEWTVIEVGRNDMGIVWVFLVCNARELTYEQFYNIPLNPVSIDSDNMIH
jgi:hypothetical protein